MQKTRPMTCCVCGESAGRWQQHHNRDTGYGLCRKCADWLVDPVKRGKHFYTPMEMADLYGMPGIHYEPKLYRLYGRDFAIVAEFQDTDEGTKAANAFMEAHRGTGLLAADSGRLILAALADKGVPA